jgi:excisionase family DNA binding protein
MACDARSSGQGAHTGPQHEVLGGQAEPHGTPNTSARRSEPETEAAPGDGNQLLLISTAAQALAMADRLPFGVTPRCFSREQAAAYLGISEDLFERLVQGGVLPSPLRFGSRRVWDRAALDGAVDRLSGLAKGPSSTASPPGKAAALEALRGPR